MKFTDGYWNVRPGFQVLHPEQAYDISSTDSAMVVHAPTRKITNRADSLNRPMVTFTYSTPMDDVIKVRIEHFAGVVAPKPAFKVSAEPTLPTCTISETAGTFTSGALSAVVHRDDWTVEFMAAGRRITASLPKGVGLVKEEAGGASFVHEELSLDVGEYIYGLGERFGPLVKNGQAVDVWNEDGGTSSEQAYKNVPFYLSNAGYGVFINHPERVALEVGSEKNTRVQFSVPGEHLEYFVIYGPTPKEVLRKYTALTGRPPRVPAWSYGLWLSTSFTTEYDEQTVNAFIDGMAERDIPLSVFHYDCFWMREFNWCDFEWDSRTFPDPHGQLARQKEKGLRICVWINPYIAQRSKLFEEGMERGYFVKKANGDVWQWDMWQAGMALVDFTNPEATAWYRTKLSALLDMGVDAFKTDFGERIPTDVVWHDGSDPQRMHNYYTQLYNKAVFDLLVEKRGAGEAVLFARSATAGGQEFPVHWGGDCDSTYASMAESIRGGLSLSLSGFGYWSHDIGGFEGLPDPGVFKRWTAFGLMSSHSRLHGSTSVRVPWAFDDEASDVLRHFTKLKLSLMPYLAATAEQVVEAGTPMMRAMMLEFPEDKATTHVEHQYMLGDALLVAPIFSAESTVDYYLPAGVWTSILTGDRVEGSRWLHEEHDFFSLPLLARPDSIIAWGARNDSPEYDYTDGVTLRCYELIDGHHSVVTVPGPDDSAIRFEITRIGGIISASSESTAPWSLALGQGNSVAATAGRASLNIASAMTSERIDS